MKDRILVYLNIFATGEPDELAKELKKELKLDDATFRQHAQVCRRRYFINIHSSRLAPLMPFFKKLFALLPVKPD